MNATRSQNFGFFSEMGNSDSKQSKPNSTTTSNASIAQSVRIRIQTSLEAEFDKRVNAGTGGLSRDNFHSCLRTVQSDFDLYSVAGSPLGNGLFEVFSSGQGFLTKEGYASAMGVVFDNNQTPSTLVSMTTQAILKWYEMTRPSVSPPNIITSDVLAAFYEASWTFAWSEIFRKLSSNMYLNGREETRALERFADSRKCHFAANIGSLGLGPDRTITISVGDNTVSVPTSFSHMSSQKIASIPPVRPAAVSAHSSALSAPVRGVMAYPEL